MKSLLNNMLDFLRSKVDSGQISAETNANRGEGAGSSVPVILNCLLCHAVLAELVNLRSLDNLPGKFIKCKQCGGHNDLQSVIGIARKKCHGDTE